MSGPDPFEPFKWTSNFKEHHDTPRKGDVKLHYNSGGQKALNALLDTFRRDMKVTRNTSMT